MARTKSSARWLKEHFTDTYVKQAQEAGYRSRAAYKLLEINERDHILRPAMTVVDLGAAPGGWSQVAGSLVGSKGRVIALDILPMEPLPGVTFLQGDFTEQPALDALFEAMHGERAGLVMSDMAPNISGLRSVDQPRAMYLAELALEFARKVLAPGGDLLMKVFQGEGYDALRKDVLRSFKQVLVRKPASSRARSREVYLLARNYYD